MTEVLSGVATIIFFAAVVRLMVIAVHHEETNGASFQAMRSAALSHILFFEPGDDTPRYFAAHPRGEAGMTNTFGGASSESASFSMDDLQTTT